MPTYRITSPDGATYEVTGPGTEQEALAQVQAQHGQAPKSKEQIYADSLKEQQAQQMKEMSVPQKFAAAMGAAPMNARLGIRQAMGAEYQDDVDRVRALEGPLMATGAGKAGNVAGSLAMLAPTILVPGANTVTGAGAVGALTGAMQPTAEDESRLKNAAIGGALGAGAQYGIGKAVGYAGDKLASKEASEAARKAVNAPKDAVLRAGQDAGYVVPPSMTESPVAARILEGISGKQKTAQLASVKNQNVTQRLASKAMGLPEDVPLNAETVKAVRMSAIESGYKPIDNIGQVATDKVYLADLDAIAANRAGVSRSFPGLKNESLDFLENLRVPEFNAADGRKAVQVLRDEAGTAFAQGEKELGKAKIQASEVIESQIERGLEALGKPGAELLKNFRDARVMIAKTGDVEKALAKGKGKVNAEVFAAALRKGKPLSGELKQIGEFADKFGEVARVPKQGWSNPFTVLDAAASSFGSPLLPAARVGARYSVLSGPGQRLANPSYGPNAAETLSPEVLELLQKYGAGGLLGGAYAGQ